MDVPDEGEVRLGDIVLSALDRAERAALRRESIAVVGQAPGLSGFLSARENVELGLALRGRRATTRSATARAEALAAVGPRRRTPSAASTSSRRVSASASRSRERSPRARRS